MEENCVFCKIIRGELPADKVFENDRVLAFLDIAPLNKGHTLVVPKEHFFGITQAPPEYQAAMIQAGAEIGAAMMRAVDADGFDLILANGACAGQVVPHTHLHVVPRFPDDGLHLPSRSIPYDGDAEKEEILEKVRARLRERAEKRGGDAS